MEDAWGKFRWLPKDFLELPEKLRRFLGAGGPGHSFAEHKFKTLKFITAMYTVKQRLINTVFSRPHLTYMSV